MSAYSFANTGHTRLAYEARNNRKHLRDNLTMVKCSFPTNFPKVGFDRKGIPYSRILSPAVTKGIIFHKAFATEAVALVSTSIVQT